MRFLAISLLLTLRATAQLPSPVTAGDHFDITGTVLDSVSAKPVARADITLQATTPNGQTRSGRTDSSGSFHFLEVPTGEYALGATRRGYAQGDGAYRQVILVSGTQPDHFSLTLDPQAVLTGAVSNGDGDPIQGAKVIVLRPVIVSGRRQLQDRETAVTDDRGLFRVAGLGPGKCFVAAVAPAPKENDDGNELGYAVTYYPNTTDAGSAQTVDLRPGTEQQANVQMTSTPTFRIRGRVAPGQAEMQIGLFPAPDAASRVMPAVQSRYDKTTSKFSLSGVPEGDYLVAAGYRDRNGRQLTGYSAVTVSGDDAEDINVAVNGGPSLRGTIAAYDGSSAGEVVSGIGVESLLNSASTAVRGTTFALGGDIPPGSYRLLATVKPNWYVQAATQGGKDVLHGKVTVVEDGASLPVQITVSPKGATIEATVTWPDKGHRTPAHVTVLEAKDGEMLTVAEATVPAPNEPAVVRPILIGDLRPGQYVVYAWPDPLNVEYASPDSLPIYDAFAQQVTVDEGQQVRVALKLALLNP